MKANIHPESLAQLGDGRIKNKKNLNRPIPIVEVSNRKMLLALTICTWIVAVLVSIAFSIAMGNDQTRTDWLAGLLLGMIILGWIMVPRNFIVADRF